LLTSCQRISIEQGIFNLHLSKYLQLTAIEKKIILSQAKSTHEEIDFTDERLGYIEKLEIIMPEKSIATKQINKTIICKIENNIVQYTCTIN
jgi:hypothetical protein